MIVSLISHTNTLRNIVLLFYVYQMKKLRQREVKWPAQVITAGHQGSSPG